MKRVKQRLVFVRGRWHVVPAWQAEGDGTPEDHTAPRRPLASTLPPPDVENVSAHVGTRTDALSGSQPHDSTPEEIPA